MDRQAIKWRANLLITLDENIKCKFRCSSHLERAGERKKTMCIFPLCIFVSVSWLKNGEKLEQIIENHESENED